MSPENRQSFQPEKLTEKEVLSRMITPTSSRILAASVDRRFLDPRTVLRSASRDRFAQELTHTSPDRLPYDAVEQVSLESRKAYWADSTQTFEEKNKAWNAAISSWVKKQRSSDPEHPTEAQIVLSSLGINMETVDTVQNGLSVEIEIFRQKYCSAKSDVLSVISAIADGCNDADTVNLATLEKRVSAVKGLFRVFGTQDVPTLIQDFAYAQGFLMQSPETKKQIAENVSTYCTTPLTGESKATFMLLRGGAPFLATQKSQLVAPTQGTGNGGIPSIPSEVAEQGSGESFSSSPGNESPTQTEEVSPQPEEFVRSEEPSQEQQSLNSGRQNDPRYVGDIHDTRDVVEGLREALDAGRISPDLRDEIERMEYEAGRRDLLEPPSEYAHRYIENDEEALNQLRSLEQAVLTHRAPNIIQDEIDESQEELTHPDHGQMEEMNDTNEESGTEQEGNDADDSDRGDYGDTSGDDGDGDIGDSGGDGGGDGE